MTRQSKTRAVAVYSDGRRYVIHRKGGLYWWRHDAASSHMDMVRANVESDGGTVVREPNPHYRPDPLPTYSRIMRSLGI